MTFVSQKQLILFYIFCVLKFGISIAEVLNLVLARTMVLF
jgi:hypothetical protein